MNYIKYLTVDTKVVLLVKYMRKNFLNTIYNNSSNINLLSNKQITTENSNNNSTNTINKTDYIEITEKDENKINTKKANDALNEACSEFNEKTGSKEKIQFIVIKEMMKLDGIDVPSFNPDDNTNGNISFLKFIDKMKDYVNKNNITDKAGNPMDKTGFLGFCDLYKEKLVKYDCK